MSETRDEFIYGMNPVQEALRGKRRAFELFVARDAHDRRTGKLLELAAEKGVPVRPRGKEDLARLCGTPHHQGVVLRLEGFPYGELEELVAACAGSPDALLLVLDSIQDPHNLGALIRSAACAGARGVVIPKDRAAGVTAVVEKASAGAVETIPVVQVTNLAQALERLKEEGFWIFGAAGDASASLYGQDLTGRTVLVIGAEGEGIRPNVRKHCDHLLAIPLQGGVASLNASVAGGVILFEAVRQRLARPGEKG